MGSNPEEYTYSHNDKPNFTVKMNHFLSEKQMETGKFCKILYVIKHFLNDFG